MEERVYSTLMNAKWTSPSEATLGDYITMRPGDSIYFFTNRQVYGIGSIIDVEPGRCITENFDGATSGDAADLEEATSSSLIPGLNTDGKVGRWIVAFKPAPLFFAEGVDMDDLLSSNPSAFKSLRTFWKRSFIKLDDAEDGAFKAALLRRNLGQLQSERDVVDTYTCPYALELGQEPDVPALLAKNRNSDGSLKRETLLEVGLLYQLSRFDPKTVGVFGKWDYLSRQVNASPFKPIDYMDRMDIFGYRWIEDFKPIIEKYIIAELKKDCSGVDDIPQIMKYVDWVRDEYTHNDYSQIKAFLVAFSFPNETDKSAAVREYVVGRRPAQSKEWDDLTLVTYQVTPKGYIEFNLI